MGDEQTASTLTLVAAIIQIIISILFIFLGIFLFSLFLPLMYDPLLWTIIGWLAFFPLLLFGLWGFFGLIVSILWFNWRHNPSEHKTGLIASGILSMIFLGGVSGILALIAGAITPSPSEYPSYEPVRKPMVQQLLRCPICGANTTGGDRFCWRCGAQL